MTITKPVKDILSYYEGELPSVKLNLARLFMHGRLGGTGRIIMLAVDQGFEHGPTTFLTNPEGFSPHYHVRLAQESGLSGYTAPLNWLKASVDSHLGAVPLILKLNHSNRLLPSSVDPDQAIVASVQDAVDLGCVGVGFTLYPGSDSYLEQLEELSDITAQARECGLFTVVWAYPRGHGVTADASDMYGSKGAANNDPRMALDTIAYSAHMACLAGAHIVKVNLPYELIARADSKDLYRGVKMDTPADRVRHIVQCCFNGRRAVIFSGGAAKDANKVLDDVQVVKQGGGTGSIIGRNIFQRPHEEALQLIEKAVRLYE
ncbi:MAG: class I fructose-bisphosphate aldolase [Holosporales bacterium]|nr:class I fructose-bisphosphate aldolase [Holosporales bacterium]